MLDGLHLHWVIQDACPDALNSTRHKRCSRIGVLPTYWSSIVVNSVCTHETLTTSDNIVSLDIRITYETKGIN